MTSPTGGNQSGWAIRARRARGEDAAKTVVYARSATLNIGEQSSFRESDEIPTVVEHFLGLIAADLIGGLVAQAPRRGILLDEIEVTVDGTLNNVLVHLGVIGERGHAGFETISVVAYVSSDAEENALSALWEEVIARAPIIATVRRSTALSLILKVVD